MALGVVEAVKKAGKQSIAKGELTATIADDLYGEGKLSVDLAIRLLNCQKVPKWVVPNQALITQENVSQFPNPPAYKP